VKGFCKSDTGRNPDSPARKVTLMIKTNNTTHAELLHSLTEISRSSQQPLEGALVHAAQTKLFLLRARRGTTGQTRRCFDRLIAALELVGMSLETLRHADSRMPPQVFQIAESATAYADASTIGVEVVQ
jgi:hypothetical protein